MRIRCGQGNRPPNEGDANISEATSELRRILKLTHNPRSMCTHSAAPPTFVRTIMESGGCITTILPRIGGGNEII